MNFSQMPIPKKAEVDAILEKRPFGELNAW
jgi:hypothetical protein